MTEDEARARVILSMCPEKVCRQCGEPSRRVVAALNNERQRIATLIGSRREALGLQRRDLLPLFVGHYKNADSVLAQISNWELAKNVPVPQDWQLLKGRLGIDTNEFDEMIAAESRWNDAEYVPHGDPARQNVEDYAQARMGQNPSAQAMPRGRATKIPRDAGFTDCGHDDWRPGVVLDPFAR